MRLSCLAVSTVLAGFLIGPTAAAAGFSDQGLDGYYARHDYRGAVQYERAWTQAEPRNPDAFFDLGGTLMLQFNDYAAAIDAFHRSLAVDATYAPSWQLMGIAYFRQHNYSAAADAFRHSARLTPTKPLPWLNLSAALSFAGDNKASVEALWDGIHAAGSNFNSAMWFHYAEALRNMNQTRQSIGIYQKALAMDGSNGAAWNDLGAVEGELGDYSQAEQCFQKAAALGVPLARENLATINRMKQQYNAMLQASQRNNSTVYARMMAQHNHDLLFYGHDVLPGDRP